MSKNTDILIIVNNLGVGGAERLVVGEVNEFTRLGHNVTLITLKSEKGPSFLKDVRLNKMSFYNFEFKGLFDVKSWIAITKLIKLKKPDLLITQLWYANTIGRIAAKLAGVKKVISFEQNVYDEVKNWKMFFIDRILQHFTTKVIAVSEAVKRSLIRHGIKDEKIEVIYNSIDLSGFSNINGDIVRQQLGIKKSEFMFLFVGRLIWQKGVDTLIRAFSRLESGYLVIAGQGKERENLIKLAHELGLGDRVIFIGVREDIAALLACSDCFILPSRHEGLPLVMTEALAAGCAVVASNFEAAKEVIVDGESGLIVPVDDVEALSGAMKKIKDDSALRDKIKAGARLRASKFSISDHVRAILRFALEPRQ